MNELIARMKQRKLVQWALAYLAAAFAPLQGVDIVAQRFGWPGPGREIADACARRGIFRRAGAGLVPRRSGAQRVSGTEIVILALLLAIGGGLLWRFERVTPTATNPDAAIVATSSRPPGATPALATVFTEPEHVKSTHRGRWRPSAFGKACCRHAVGAETCCKTHSRKNPFHTSPSSVTLPSISEETSHEEGNIPLLAAAGSDVSADRGSGAPVQPLPLRVGDGSEASSCLGSGDDAG
ncbi:MAG TPA: hypothetical protein VIM92_12860 [Rhodanobacteraceae bacterium]